MGETPQNLWRSARHSEFICLEQQQACRDWNFLHKHKLVVNPASDMRLVLFKKKKQTKKTLYLDCTGVVYVYGITHLGCFSAWAVQKAVQLKSILTLVGQSEYSRRLCVKEGEMACWHPLKLIQWQNSVKFCWLTVLRLCRLETGLSVGSVSRFSGTHFWRKILRFHVHHRLSHITFKYLACTTTFFFLMINPLK